MAAEDAGRRPIAQTTGASPPSEAPAHNAGLAAALVGGAVVIAGLYFAAPVLQPLALAVLLSLMLAPAVRWLQRYRFNRAAAVAVAVALAAAVILGFGAAVGDEAINFVQRLPQYETNIAAKIRSLNGAMPGSGIMGRATHVFRDLGDELSHLAPAAAPGAGNGAAAPTAPIPVVVENGRPLTLQILRDIVGPLLGPLSGAGLVVVFVVMFLVNREDLRDRVLRLAGVHDLHRTTAAMNDAAERVSSYLLMQLGVGVCYGVPIAIGLAVIGVPNAFLWGMLGVGLRFMPYVGGPLTGVLPVVLSIAVAPGWGVFLWTLLLFVGMEVVVANLVEPWAYSRSTGLSAIAVVVAAVFWTWLWGVLGLLLATPLTVCLVVLGRYVPQLQFLDILLGNQPVLSPQESLYQRLLAHDPEEATEQAEEFARQTSLAAFFDDVAIPALAMAQADSDRRALSGRQRDVIAQGFAALLENLAEDGIGEAAGDAGDDHGDGDGHAAIVCLGGRNELDLAAAWLLQRLLQARGHDAVVLQPEALSGPAVERVRLLQGAAIVCLSLLSTSSTARARYLVRRVRRQARRAHLIVGCWGRDAADFSSEEAIAETAADHVVTTLAAAVAEIGEELGEPAAAARARQSA